MGAIEFTEADLDERAAKVLGRPRLPTTKPSGELLLRPGPFLGPSPFAQELRALGASTAALAMLEARGIRSIDSLLTRDRNGRLTMARHELQAWLKRHVPRISYPEIGRLFGQNHTTVMSACTKIRRLASEDERIARRQAIPRDEPKA